MGKEYTPVFDSLKRKNGRKASVYVLCGHFCSCIDMCYIFVVSIFICFVSLIILRMDDLEMNS